MNKEEIYENYWKRLVQIRKVCTGNNADEDTMYLYYKRQAERDRDSLLEKYGHDPFFCE